MNTQLYGNHLLMNRRRNKRQVDEGYLNPVVHEAVGSQYLHPPDSDYQGTEPEQAEISSNSSHNETKHQNVTAEEIVQFQLDPRPESDYAHDDPMNSGPKIGSHPVVNGQQSYSDESSKEDPPIYDVGYVEEKKETELDSYGDVAQAAADWPPAVIQRADVPQTPESGYTAPYSHRPQNLTTFPKYHRPQNFEIVPKHHRTKNLRTSPEDQETKQTSHSVIKAPKPHGHETSNEVTPIYDVGYVEEEKETKLDLYGGPPAADRPLAVLPRSHVPQTPESGYTAPYSHRPQNLTTFPKYHRPQNFEIVPKHHRSKNLRTSPEDQETKQTSHSVIKAPKPHGHETSNEVTPIYDVGYVEEEKETKLDLYGGPPAADRPLAVLPRSHVPQTPESGYTAPYSNRPQTLHLFQNS